MSSLGAVGEGLVELTLGRTTRELQLGFGGDVANVCVMAAELGAPARLAGRVGADGLGGRLLAFWRRRGVDVAAIRRDLNAPTGLYLNEEVGGGEHSFTYWRTGSAGARLEPADLEPAFFEGMETLVVSGITLAVSDTSARAAWRAIELARDRGARVACILNHRPALGGDTQELADLARRSDVLIASQEDADAVFGEREPAALARALERGPRELVLTNGPRPAAVATEVGIVRQAVPPVPVRNAAGAGDALAGAYLAARLRGDSPAQSLAWGVAASALSVGSVGCAASYPSLSATRSLFRRLDEPEVVGAASEAGA